MGRQAKAKTTRREERKVMEALETAGVAERVRNVFLALRRAEIQAAIKERANEGAPWAERDPMNNVAAKVLQEFGYDLTGLTIQASMKPGRRFMDGLEMKQEPPTIVFTADVSEEALSAAYAAAGIKTKGAAGQAPAYN